jgi:hypothetical protein
LLGGAGIDPDSAIPLVAIEPSQKFKNRLSGGGPNGIFETRPD